MNVFPPAPDAPEPIPNNEALYDAQIRPLLDHVLRIAKDAHMPVIMNFQLSPDGPQGVLYAKSIIVPKAAAMRMHVLATVIESELEPAGIIGVTVRGGPQPPAVRHDA